MEAVMAAQAQDRRVYLTQVPVDHAYRITVKAIRAL